jgi:hypothetical protein
MAASLMMLTAEKSSAFVTGRTSYVERYFSSCSYVQLRFQTYNRIDIAFDHLTHDISCRATGVLRADPLATKAAAIWRPLPTDAASERRVTSQDPWVEHGQDVQVRCRRTAGPQN